MAPLRRALLCVLCVALFDEAYPAIEGMPRGACNSLYPRHYTDAQTTEPPYEISTEAHGDAYRVIIESADPEIYFRGFVIQGMVDGDVSGRFTLDDGESEVRMLECPRGRPNNIDNTATHVNNAPKYHIALNYFPDEGVDPSKVTFRATIVRVMLEFWHNIQAPLVRSSE